MQSITRYVLHLRTRPEQERQRILLLVTCILTAIVALAWLVDLRYRLLDADEKPTDIVTSSPLETLKGQVQGLVEGVKKRFVFGK